MKTCLLCTKFILLVSILCDASHEVFDYFLNGLENKLLVNIWR